MADYLVLEEDGTSHLELEESTDDFLTEESGVLFGSVTFPLTVTFGTEGTQEAPPPAYATWRVGTITIPSGNDTVSVTGLGGRPDAVFFWGTNWSDEDTAVTSTEKAIFRGMAARKWDDPSTILQSVMMVAPAGDYYNGSIAQCGLAFEPGGDGYNLVFQSFDSDGFTVDTSEQNSAGLKVVYAALFNVNDIGAYVGTAATNSHGWKAGAAMVHGGLGGPGAPSFGNLGHSGGWWGSAAYPGTAGGGTWMGAGLSANTFPDAAGIQYIIGVYNNAPGTKISDTAAFVGPFLTPSNSTMTPTGGPLTDFAVQFGNSNGGMYVAWDDEDNATGLVATPPTSTGNTHAISGLSFPPGLVIGYTISDEPQGQSSGSSRGAVGFSVVADGFQWCATIDGASSFGAFQSFQRGYADTVNGTSVHAGTIELTSDGFVMTTEEDDVGPNDWAWHAFGHPDQVVMWIPQIYRRQP